jgi:Caspase recruitment domain
LLTKSSIRSFVDEAFPCSHISSPLRYQTFIERMVLVTYYIKLPKSNEHKLFECVEHEDVKTESPSRNWIEELIHLIDFNHGFLDDLMSRNMLEYEDQVDDLEAKSSSLVQRGRLLDLMVKRSPTDTPQFLEALRSTGQEHVANFITRNGCK